MAALLGLFNRQSVDMALVGDLELVFEAVAPVRVLSKVGEGALEASFQELL